MVAADYTKKVVNGEGRRTKELLQRRIINNINENAASTTQEGEKREERRRSWGSSMYCRRKGHFYKALFHKAVEGKGNSLVITYRNLSVQGRTVHNL